VYLIYGKAKNNHKVIGFCCFSYVTFLIICNEKVAHSGTDCILGCLEDFDLIGTHREALGGGGVLSEHGLEHARLDSAANIEGQILGIDDVPEDGVDLGLVGLEVESVLLGDSPVLFHDDHVFVVRAPIELISIIPLKDGVAIDGREREVGEHTRRKERVHRVLVKLVKILLLVQRRGRGCRKGGVGEGVEKIFHTLHPWRKGLDDSDGSGLLHDDER
jgi:hypothetical protein